MIIHILSQFEYKYHRQINMSSHGHYVRRRVIAVVGGAIAGAVVAVAGILAVSGVCRLFNVHPAWLLEGQSYSIAITNALERIRGDDNEGLLENSQEAL